MKCHICKIGIPEGATLYRLNKPGEMPAIWSCKKHMTFEQIKTLDPILKEIVETIENCKHEYNEDSTVCIKCGS